MLTYIDYDLDVIRKADGNRQVVDQDEYEMHKMTYHYPKMVEDKVRDGLKSLLERMDKGLLPFHEQQVRTYYEDWYQKVGEGEG